MIEFHDYDPAHPFDVENEEQTITDGKIILNYVPLQNSIEIDGFHAATSKSELASGAFFIDYHASDNYLSADGVVYFADTDNGRTVTVNYKGVSTLLRASHMNEIKRFIERGASELAARILVTHEQIMFDKLQDWRDGILAELQGIKDTLAAMNCCCKEAITPDMIADDDEADALLDNELIEGDVTPTEKTSTIATNEEADTMLDEYFFTPAADDEENPTGIEDVANEEEFQTMLEELFPGNG